MEYKKFPAVSYKYLLPFQCLELKKIYRLSNIPIFQEATVPANANRHKDTKNLRNYENKLRFPYHLSSRIRRKQMLAPKTNILFAYLQAL